MDQPQPAVLPKPIFILIALFLVLIGVRLSLIHALGSPTPYWDDWSIGVRLAKYVESGFDLSWLLNVANEHRASFMKLTHLSLFELNNRQWDPLLNMSFNAFLWATIGTFFASLGFKNKDQVNPWFLLAVVIVLWSYPLSLFNTLSLVQTYVYYMILFSILGFWLTTNNIFSTKWWIGCAFLLFAAFTAGGGSFAAVAVASVSFFLAALVPDNRRQHIITGVAAALISIVGLYLLLSQGFSGGETIESINGFLETVFKVLSWPMSNKAWPSAFLLAPILILAMSVGLKQIEDTRLVRFTLTGAGFGVLLAIAIAYARGGEGIAPPERYFDFLTIFFISSTLALCLIQKAKLPKYANTTLIVAWAVIIVLAIPYNIKVLQYTLNERETLTPIQDEVMTRFTLSEDLTLFEGKAFREVPFPHYDILESMVQEIKRADVMPYQLQAPTLTLPDSGPFIADGIISPGNHKYRNEETPIGSFNIPLGAQNATGEFVSDVIEAKRPYVMVPHIGYLGYDGLTLKLVGEHNKKIVHLTSKTANSKYAHAWRSSFAKAPDTHYRVIASDDSKDLWLAIAAPRSVGKMTYYTQKLLKKSDSFWKYGILLFLFLFRHQLVTVFSQRFRVNNHRSNAA